MTARDNMIAFCNKHGLNAAKILSRRRTKELVAQRRILCSWLRLSGHSYSEIARAMNRHHTSIMYLLKHDMAAKKLERMALRYDSCNSPMA